MRVPCSCVADGQGPWPRVQWPLHGYTRDSVPVMGDVCDPVAICTAAAPVNMTVEV